MRNFLSLCLIFWSVLSAAQSGLLPLQKELTFREKPRTIATIYGTYPIAYFTGELKPPSEDLVFFNPGNYLHRFPLNQFQTSPRVPLSSRFYFNEVTIRPAPLPPDVSREDYLASGRPEEDLTGPDSIKDFRWSEERVSAFFRPFFIRRYEVTNREYMAFVHYVRDSLAHVRLGHTDWQGKVDWEQPIDWSAPEAASLFVSESGKRKLKAAELVYAYADEAGKRVAVPVYPDTTCWTKDQSVVYNAAMERNYFWHPAFADYPVVGVTWHQAMAFCHWKTRELNRALRGKYEVIVSLPTAYEWEWVAAHRGEQEHPVSDDLIDDTWTTKLVIDSEHYEDPLWRTFTGPVRYVNNFPVDGGMMTVRVDQFSRENRKHRRECGKQFAGEFTGTGICFLNLDPNDIAGLGNNVSEWLLESYPDNWGPAFERRQQALAQTNTPEALLLFQLERHFDGYNDREDGRLVRGANWLDERYSLIDGKNRAGIYAKRFVSPDRAHATIGFRYVVRLEAL